MTINQLFKKKPQKELVEKVLNIFGLANFDDNKNLASDSEGIRDVSSNQTNAYSGSHSGFTGNFFRNVVDQAKTHIPSIGALRRTTNKV